MLLEQAGRGEPEGLTGRASRRDLPEPDSGGHLVDLATRALGTPSTRAALADNGDAPRQRFLAASIVELAQPILATIDPSALWSRV